MRSGGLVVRITFILLPKGRWEVGHDLSLSPLDKWRGVVMATPPSLSEGRSEGGYDLCYYLPQKLNVFPYLLMVMGKV